MAEKAPAIGAIMGRDAAAGSDAGAAAPANDAAASKTRISKRSSTVKFADGTEPGTPLARENSEGRAEDAAEKAAAKLARCGIKDSFYIHKKHLARDDHEKQPSHHQARSPPRRRARAVQHVVLQCVLSSRPPPAALLLRPARRQLRASFLTPMPHVVAAYRG